MRYEQRLDEAQADFESGRVRSAAQLLSRDLRRARADRDREAAQAVDSLAIQMRAVLEAEGLRAKQAGDTSGAAHWAERLETFDGAFNDDVNAPRRSSTVAFVWLLISVGLMVLGAIGPWATAFGIASVSGLGGGRDGWIVLVAAAVAALAAFPAWQYGARATAAISALMGAGSATAAIYDWAHVPDAAGVSVGWGLTVAVAASCSLTVASLVLVFGRPRPRTPVVGEQPSRDRIDRLAQLAEMHRTGVLSESEFEQEKVRLLAE